MVLNKPRIDTSACFCIPTCGKHLLQDLVGVFEPWRKRTFAVASISEGRPEVSKFCVQIIASIEHLALLQAF